MEDIGWEPNTSPARIYLSCFWFVTIVIAATYTANLVATLASQKSDAPLKTLDDLTAADGMTVLVRPHTFYRTLLEVSPLGGWHLCVIFLFVKTHSVLHVHFRPATYQCTQTSGRR